MKYTNEEMVSEILKRSDKVRDERRKRNNLYLGTASAVLLAALIAVIGFMPTGMSGGYTENTMYGAFLLGREAGVCADAGREMGRSARRHARVRRCGGRDRGCVRCRRAP